jgi:hypothetical protein
MRAAGMPRDESFRRDLVPRINSIQPLGKKSNYAQPCRPRLAARTAKALLPPHEESGIDMTGRLAFSEADEPAKDSLCGSQIEAQTAPDCEVLLQTIAQRRH